MRSEKRGRKKEDRPHGRGEGVSLVGKTKSEMWTQSVAVQRVEEPVVAINDVLMVSEAKAAKLLGVSRRTVFALNKQGVLSARRVGKRKLYSVESLKNFAELGVA